MTVKASIKAVESRAFAARLTLSELCEKAGVPLPSWSRAKRRSRISVETLRKMEGALDVVEAERNAQAAA